MTWRLFVLSLLFSPAMARAACDNIQMQLNPSSINLTSSATTQASVTVKANTQNGGCQFFVAFDYGAGGTFSSRHLVQGSNNWPYQLAKDSSGTQVLKTQQETSGVSNVLNGTMPNNSGNDVQITLSYWVILDLSNPWLRFGNYSDNVTLRLYTGNPNNATFIQSQGLGLNYNAPKRADVSVVPTGGSFNVNDTTETLNYGTITSGLSRGCDVILKTNAGYELYASSQRNGALKHSVFTNTIGYTAKFSNVTVNLGSSASNPVQIARVLGTSPASGFVIPFAATINTYPVNTPGGTYSDQITLTVQSAE